MFSSLKLGVLRPRSRSLSNGTTSCTGAESSSSLLCKSSKTSVGSPKTKNSKKRNSDLIPCSTFNQTPTCSGSRVHQTNGMGTSMMRPEELSSLPHDPIDDAMLEIEYSLPEYGSQNSLCITTRVTEIRVERVDGSLGITLRGGLVPEHPNLSRPLVITQVRKNGPAYRTGLVRVGDRLLKVDHHSLMNRTLLEAQQILKDCTQDGRAGLSTLTIEYDVSVMESVRYANGPLLLEIERQCDEDFGLVLSNVCDQEKEDGLGAGGNGLYIERVIPASTAERCGALCVGDRLLAIDDVSIPSHCAAEAQRMLRKATRLQILPGHASLRSPSRSTTREVAQSPSQLDMFQGMYSISKSPAPFNTWNSKRSQNNMNRLHRQSSIQKPTDSEFGGSYCSYTNNSLSGVSHPETITVALNFERGVGYGLTVSVGEHSDNRPADILISWIASDSPAYRCGCLQVGDRILAVNYQANLTLQEINSILELGSDQNGKITLQVEFDVADSFVPSSGIFTVKLAKRGPGLGITITASKIRPDEPFIISGLQRGSTAHRTGTLRPGDRLLAVDDRPLDRLNSADAACDVLQRAIAGEVVSLTVEKMGDGAAGRIRQIEEEERVEYTVELRRKDGPLGVTIAGSEDCREPIVLSRLTEGGLAERTGALHVGDAILAINGESLEHKPLSEAIRLLQSSRDRVQLKIARNLKSNDRNLLDPRCSYSSPGLMSVDSAVDSWDSNTMDNPNENCLEIKDAESILSEALSYQDHDKDFGSSSLAAHSKRRDSQLQYYSDTDEMILFPSPLPCYNFGQHVAVGNSGNRLPTSGYNSKSNSAESIIPWESDIYHVTLYKDAIYDDYGFSVSDGLYEKGVYVNRIRKGGPADIVGLLKPYDRIVQVNDVKTQDFDCCLTVPLIASAGDRIELIIARNPYLNLSEKESQQDKMSKKSLSLSQNTIVKTL